MQEIENPLTNPNLSLSLSLSPSLPLPLSLFAKCRWTGTLHSAGWGRPGLTCGYSGFIIIDDSEWQCIPEVLADFSASKRQEWTNWLCSNIAGTAERKKKLLLPSKGHRWHGCYNHERNSWSVHQDRTIYVRQMGYLLKPFYLSNIKKNAIKKAIDVLGKSD